jgi:hypothetical protein
MELPASYRSKFLGFVKDQEQQLEAFFTEIAERIGAILIEFARGPEQIIPPEQTSQVQSRVGGLITSAFLAPDGSGGLAPFVEGINGLPRPISPYADIIFNTARLIMENEVERHAAIMRRYLPDDLIALFEAATDNPFTATDAPAIEMIVFEQEYNRQLFMQYDPWHLFVRPDGYRLSDRIWRIEAETRRRLDLYMQEAIAEGKSSYNIAREVETFLHPGEQIRRTTKPYGRDVSYSAMRLARTERTAAASQSGMMGASLNPFIAGYKTILSPQHECCDECDTIAAGGPYEIGDWDNAPPIHPHCMCHIQWVLHKDRAGIVRQLREEAEMANRPDDSLLNFVGPLMVKRFVNMLMGER